MDGYDSATYGDAWATIYDDPLIPYPATEDIVSFLQQLAPHGPALELGVGTGRIAIPLARAGYEVVGVDTSDRMLSAARAKVTAEDKVTLSKGDMTRIDDFGSKFSLAYSVGFSFLQLGDARKQEDCLKDLVRQLSPGATVVLDSILPDRTRFRRNQDFVVGRLTTDRVLCTATIHHPEQQVLSSQAIEFTNDGIRLFPNEIRYVTKSELDAMASAAGLVPVGAWGGWRKQPLTDRPGPWVAAYQYSGAQE